MCPPANKNFVFRLKDHYVDELKSFKRFSVTTNRPLIFDKQITPLEQRGNLLANRGSLVKSKEETATL